MTEEAGGESSENFSLVASSSLKGKRSPSPESSQLSSAKAEVLPESICPLCLNLGNELWVPEYRDKHGLGGTSEHLADARDVVRAAEQGCSGCRIVSWVLEPYLTRLKEHGNVAWLEFGMTDINSCGRVIFRELRFYEGIEPTRYAHRTLAAHIVVKSMPCESGRNVFVPSRNLSCPWRWVLPGEKITDQTGSVAAVEKVRAWFSECVSKHEKCRQASSPRLPTRIIRIDGPNQVRLHTSKNEYAAYACLSHCWGGESVSQTTTKTFEQYSVGIPWVHLPKTFQHAINFAYSIGISNIWIDSLCIVQDSTEDWRHEGSRMSQIYSNASITLSATWATKPSQGCFVTPDERYLSRTKTFTNSGHAAHELHCHERLPQFPEKPLHDRGWVYQEQTLSNRIVHFMEQELWWECQECFVCECCDADHCHVFEAFKDLAAELNELSSLDEIGRKWEEVVYIYTQKLLTYPSDIFPAIQALAKLVPSKMGIYLAGH